MADRTSTGTHRRQQREAGWAHIESTLFDVVVIGGGINGACVFEHSGRSGRSALLLDGGDFSSGTSQSSAMMIWGGLLYLRHLDFRAVRRLCAAREQWLREQHDAVRLRQFRYLPAPLSSSRKLLLHAAIHLYWLLGDGRRSRPQRERSWPGQETLRSARFTDSFLYEDAMIEPSDARSVLGRVLGNLGPNRTALNYAEVADGGFDRVRKRWRFRVHDRVLNRCAEVQARCVVNAAGVWTDSVNQRFKITTPYKHLLSKGVSIAVRRDPRLTEPLVFDTRTGQDAMVLIPWGPVSLWGSTECPSTSIEEGFRATADDTRLLLDEYNRNMATPIEPSDIVSVRTGLRPLAVRRNALPPPNLLAVSRRPRIVLDSQTPWISVFGGKFTDAPILAREVEVSMTRAMGRAKSMLARSKWSGLTPAPTARFPGLEEPVPDAAWSAEHEMCWTLEDFLRRRSNVAQWVPRGGFGVREEHTEHIRALARVICEGDAARADDEVHRYRRQTRENLDSVLMTPHASSLAMSGTECET